MTGALAQLVEQRTENPCVPGSIPGGTTIKTRTNLFGFFSFKAMRFYRLVSFYSYFNLNFISTGK